MKKNKNVIKSLKYFGATASLLFSTDAMAAGLNSLSNGAKMSGVGGAGLAVSFDPTSGSGNPASIAKLDNEISSHVGVARLPQKSDSTKANLTFPLFFLKHTRPIHNHDKLTPGGFGGFVYKLDDRFTIGASMTGNVNLVNYHTSIATPYGHAPSKVHSAILLLNNTMAYKVTPTLNVGASLILGYLSFKGNPTLFPRSTLSRGSYRRDEATGFGGRVGVQWDPTEMVGLGLAVTSPISFGKLKKYGDYFHKGLQYPWVIGAGSVFHVNKQTDILFDVVGEFWGKSSSFRYKPTKGAGWKDTVEFKLGVQYKAMENLPLRLGYRYAPSVVPHNQILFNSFYSPAIFAEHAVTGGLSYRVNKAFETDFAVIYRFKKSFTDNGTGRAGFAAHGLKLYGSELAFILGLNYKY